MHITEHFELPLVGYYLGEVLGRINYWLQVETWVIPLSIFIVPSEVCSLITLYHTVDVEHWNHIEYVVFSEGLCFLSISQQEVDNALKTVGGLGLSGMNPRCNQHCFLVIIQGYVLTILLVQRLYFKLRLVKIVY